MSKFVSNKRLCMMYNNYNILLIKYDKYLLFNGEIQILGIMSID